MIESLITAGERLRAALDHYVGVCSSIRDYSSNGSTHHQFSREVARQLDAELTYFASYETNIHQARRNIAHARNYSSPLVPINTIPSEIFTRIFSLVASPCNLHLLSSDDDSGFPKYPEHLLGVCSGWNRTILSAPSLWAHIDLTPEDLHCQASLTRAHLCLERTGGMPLHIHIADSDNTSEEYANDFFDFLASNASHMKTLEFDISCTLDVDHTLIFQELLAKYTRHFTELIIQSHLSVNPNAFILPAIYGRSKAHVDIVVGSLLVDLPQQDVEESFTNLEVLHLQGLFPYWTSNAYYGLVDLRLTSSPDNWSSITQSQIVRILRDCPELQILHLALIVTETNSHMDIKPVHLRSLEVLNLSAAPADEFDSSTSQLASVLRLLAPGEHPLRLTLKNGFYDDEPLVIELKEFFLRSLVVNLCVKEVYPPLRLLLDLAANLQALIFESCAYGSDPFTYISSSNQLIWFPPSLDSFPHLKSWYILNCQVSLTELDSMVELDENNTLVLSKCTFIDEDGQPNQLSDTELSAAFPDVRFIPNNTTLPNPTADWDFLV